MHIIHKDCDPSLSKDRSLPINSYIITYTVDDIKKHDIVQASGFVEVFDVYYDQYGKDTIKSIKWTEGRVNPRLYGYKIKETKKRK
jgi:hypothetical protein